MCCDLPRSRMLEDQRAGQRNPIPHGALKLIPQLHSTQGIETRIQERHVRIEIAA